ncbi:MAG: hypothetical protein ACE5Z5_06515 [Candidatus Bathyarchaeia archaeon]
MPLGIFVAKAVISRGIRGRKRRVALMMFCLLASALMATIVPTFVVLPLVLCMAVYDLYTVRYGPIKKIAEYQDGLDIMVAHEMGGWGLGFGDLIFYSVLTSGSLSYTMIHISRFAFYDASRLVGVLTPWAVFALVTMAILTGLTKALRLLEDKSLIPGLPIPIFAGCGVFGLCILALQLVNYFGWGWFVPPF